MLWMTNVMAPSFSSMSSFLRRLCTGLTSCGSGAFAGTENDDYESELASFIPFYMRDENKDDDYDDDDEKSVYSDASGTEQEYFLMGETSASRSEIMARTPIEGQQDAGQNPTYHLGNRHWSMEGLIDYTPGTLVPPLKPLQFNFPPPEMRWTKKMIAAAAENVLRKEEMSEDSGSEYSDEVGCCELYVFCADPSSFLGRSTNIA